MNRLKWWLGILLLIVFMGIQMPAAWVAQQLSPILSEQGSQLTQVQGSVWHGSAVLYSQWLANVPMQLHWQWQVSGLRLAQWRWSIQGQQEHVHVQAHYAMGWQGWQLDVVASSDVPTPPGWFSLLTTMANGQTTQYVGHYQQAWLP